MKLIYVALLAVGALVPIQPSPAFAARPVPAPSVNAALPAKVGKSTVSALLPPQTKTQSPHLMAAAASCTPADFGSRTGSALVSFVKASTAACINTLFGLTGNEAYNAFREAQMVTIATGMRDTGYPGNNSTSVLQLVLFMRAGYYVQFYHPGDVGGYGPALKAATRSALDTFYANPRTQDVTDANGEVLHEAVTLIDSAGENTRYLYVVRRVLTAFNSQYNQLWYLRNAVNNTFTVLFRGHWIPEFNTAIAADPSILDILSQFANTHFSLLGTDSSFLISNAGGELTRFLDNAPLVGKVRPLSKALLDRSAMTGPTAPLWIRVADVASYHDAANCAYYGICGFKERLAATVLPITHRCASPAATIRAQDISTTNLNASCASMSGQVSYFHNLVRDNATPVANDYNATLEVVVFHSSDDYQTYAGVLFGIDTNNGGMYLEGDPAVNGNVPRFIAYEAEWLRPTFAVWNLNHEFTHYLDGRFNLYGDFARSISVPNIWWIEGVAEYVSYHYRGITYAEAIAAARLHTYSLSTLWNTTYENSDTERIYRWGYLATRYMFERHPNDVYAMLAKFRANDYTGARAVYATTIGTRYNADFDAWLDTLGSSNSPPVANFTTVVNGLTATFTDTSTDADGSIVARLWNFGDGSTSSATNPAHTYASAGSYTVTLTVTDNRGASASKQTTVSLGTGTTPECTGSDVRALGQNCKRSNLSAATGNLVYLYIYLPAGVSTLSIGSTGGTGNADLYYNPSTWAGPGSYTARSVNAGNTESITVTNPAAGYRYISLYGVTSFTGVTVTTRY